MEDKDKTPAKTPGSSKAVRGQARSNSTYRKRWKSNRVNDAQRDAARAVHVSTLTRSLGLTPARERNKFACVACASSDAMHIDEQNDRAKCYSCGGSWDSIGLVQAVRGVDFRGAVAELAGEALPVGSRKASTVRALKGGARPRGVSLPMVKPAPAPVLTTIWDSLERAHKVAVPTWVSPDGVGYVGLSEGASAYLEGRGLDGSHEAVRSCYGERLRSLVNHYSLDELDGAGLISSSGKVMASWLHEVLVLPYFAPDGTIDSLRFRRFHKRDNWFDAKTLSLRGRVPSDPFLARRVTEDTKRVIERVDEAKRCGNVLVVVEGELDALAMDQTGLRAIGVPGASAWREHWVDPWRDLGRVVVLADADEAGEGLYRLIRKACAERLGKQWAKRVLRGRQWVGGDGSDAVDRSSHARQQIARSLMGGAP